MGRIGQFIKSERLYLLLIVFIILVNVIVLSPAKEGKLKAKSAPAALVSKEEAKEKYGEMFIEREEAEKKLRQNPALRFLFSLASLLIFAVILLGLVLDAIFVSLKFKKAEPDIRTHILEKAGWNTWDVAKVVILFLFFGYMVVIIESILARTFPVLKNDNLRMIVNSLVLDTLGVVFILYFTIGRYKERLVSLGISVSNFFKNVYYGMLGYVAAVPILILLLLATVVVARLINYVPEQQEVVKLFLKEDNKGFLIFTTFFASVVGPIIEEIFFRAFMYGALKKAIGIFWAALFTSAVFSVLHAHIVGFLPIMVLGLLLIYMYERTGTLVAPITAHIMHNTGMVFMVFLMKEIKAV